jgi:hypothetical protein
MAAADDGTEQSVASAYCVVYRLQGTEWVVAGQGWSQVGPRRGRESARARARDSARACVCACPCAVPCRAVRASVRARVDAESVTRAHLATAKLTRARAPSGSPLPRHV